MADPTPKICTLCGEAKPLSEYHAKGGVPGASARCRTCVNSKSKAWYEANRDRANAEKALRYRKDPDANAAYRRAYYKANREAALARAKAWREENGDKAASYRKRHYEDNRNTYVAGSRRWREENPERQKKTKRAWASLNPEKVQESSRRRRARKKAATIGPVDLDVLWTGFCGICAGPISRRPKWPAPDSKSIDHIIPLAKGGSHTQDNLQWAHLRCNMAKGDRLDLKEAS